MWSIVKYQMFNKTSCFKVKDLFYRYFNNIAFEDIPEVSPTIIKKVFKTYNITYDEGYTCFIIACPICNNITKTNDRNIYINKATGMYMCSICKQSGQWNSLDKYFDKKIRKNPEEIKKLQNEQVDKLYKNLEQIRNQTIHIQELIKNNKIENIFKKFNLPVIRNDCAINLDIRIDNVNENLYFPLENVNSEIVGYNILNISTSSNKFIESNITFGGLLTAKSIRNKDTVIVVPKLADFLTLLNANINKSIVCLPNGVNSLSQYFLPSFERFKKIILWFGNDIKSWESARHFSKKLGDRRCLFIRPNENILEPHLMKTTDFKNIINEAQPIWHKSITTFATLRSDILSELQNVDKVDGVKWKRYPLLNKLLKGHRRGELTVITGPTGSGKTTFISEYSLDLAMQGVNTLWGSFEIRNVRLAKMMLQQFVRTPLDTNLQMFDQWADKFERLPIYFMTFHGQQTIKIVMDAVEHATYVHDISHVIIDNLQFMMGIMDESKHIDRFWKQDAIISAFRTFATKKNCHVTLVIHPRKEREDLDLTTSSIFGGAKASQEADNVLIIQDKRLISTRGKKYLQIAKNRYSGDLGVMPLDFDKPGLSYATKKVKKNPDDSKEENNILRINN